MARQAIPDVVFSHWSTLIEGFQASSLAFYTAVEEAVKRREVPETKNTRIDYKEAGFLSADREYLRVSREKLVFDICAAPFGTGFFVSWWLVENRPRIHPLLRLAIVLAIFGSVPIVLMIAIATLWNLGIVAGLVVMGIIGGAILIGVHLVTQVPGFDDSFIRELPIIGALYLWLFKPDTYYRLDSMQMFQTAVHNAVTEVIDSMTAAQGLRALSESERKPVLEEFYRKIA